VFLKGYFLNILGSGPAETPDLVWGWIARISVNMSLILERFGALFTVKKALSQNRVLPL